MIVKYYTNINKTNNHLSPQIIEHEKNYEIWRWKSRYRHNNVECLNRLIEVESSFWWHWWTCWPSLFKHFFINLSEFVFISILILNSILWKTWSVWIKYVGISFHFKFKEFLQLVNHSSIFSWNLMKLHSRWRVKLCTYVSYFFLPVYFFKLFQLYLNIVLLKLHSCKVQMSGIVCNKNAYDTFLEQPSSSTPNVKTYLKPKHSRKPKRSKQDIQNCHLCLREENV